MGRGRKSWSAPHAAVLYVPHTGPAGGCRQAAQPAAHAGSRARGRSRRAAVTTFTEEDRDGYARSGPPVRAPPVRSPSWVHGDRGPVPRARDRREQLDLRHARRVRLPPVSLSAAGPAGGGGRHVPQAVVRNDLRRNVVARRVPGHPDGTQLRARRLVRSRQPQHLRRRRARACLHGAAARRSVSGDGHGAGPGPRLYRGRARSERSTGSDHQPSPLAEPLRRRSRHPEPPDSRERPRGVGGRGDAARIGPHRDRPLDSVGRRSVDRPAQRPAVQRARPSRAWRVAGAGQRRACIHRQTSRAGGEGGVRGVRELATDGDAMGGGAAQRRPAGGIHPAGRRRAGAPHRLRQPHEPVPRAVVCAAARAGRASGARRGAMACDAARPD